MICIALMLTACRGWHPACRSLTCATCSLTQLALVFLSLPGRVLGSEIRPRRFK